jgi:UDP-2-acetamido-3-amino-2,3-dideoxy-glucuronate N-acetyltransferase
MPLTEQRYADPARWRVATTVGRGASLGAGAVIGPGVRIGEFAMVGAGAVVTHDVQPHRLVVGNPARPIGWVCACGRRLDSGLACSSCGAAYRPNEQGGLVPG